ncbi:DUF7373 family lipoprotein [Nocardia rosealba]|uniref:DUF7373 family lipoprotein n=1 Tax=Nocardia rosealba TaxID=2878563 RepID=UPI001CDA3EEB|nr:hypothetical protein [Nocardia rosealba]MCA2210275.1 hypothetical protein [Nocardia rosealba]
MKNSLRLIGLLTVLTLGSGCASTVSGQAKPGVTPVDIAALKTGAQVVEPTPFELNFSSHTAQRIRLIEGRQLLNLLVHPIDFMPSLTELDHTRIFADSSEMSKTGGLPSTFNAIVDQNDLVSGVSTVRTNGSARATESMYVGVLHFGTAENAKNVSTGMFEVSTRGEPPRQPIEIPGYPQANGTIGTASVNAFQAHGPFVVVTSIQQPQPDRTALPQKIQKVLDAQIKALDSYKPVPADDLLDLPLDQDGIMRRTMGKSPAGDPFGMSFHQEDFGTFQPSGILHYERHTLETRKAFEAAGVDLVGRRYSTVYRTRDVESAFLLQTALARRGKEDAVLDPPPGIADAQCVRLSDTDPNRGYNGFCVLVHGRYVAVVMAMATASRTALQADPVLQERTAAQYLIFEKSE